jgi:ribosomal-protein-alanine N-acetyltransferase
MVRPRQRAMLARDVDAVVAIEAAAYGHPWSRGNFIDSLASGYRAELLEDAAAGLIGYCVAMQGVDELHLLNVTVAPAFQGQGHGRALLDDLERDGRAHGLATLWLEVRLGNERARALYRRRGYAEVGVRRGYYPAAVGREDAIVMRLMLDAACAAPPAPDPDAAHAVV